MEKGRGEGNSCFVDGLEMTPDGDVDESNFLTTGNENGCISNGKHFSVDKRKEKKYLREPRKGLIPGILIAVAILVISVSLITWFLLSKKNSVPEESNGKPMLNASAYNIQGIPGPNTKYMTSKVTRPIRKNNTVTSSPNTVIIKKNNTVTSIPYPVISETNSVKDVEIDREFLQKLQTKVNTLMCTEATETEGAVDDRMYEQARENTDMLWNMYTRQDGWKIQSPEDVNISIQSAFFDDIGVNIFRLKAKLKIPAEQLYIDLIEKAEEAASWNPTVKHMEILRSINTCTDIIYQVSAEMADGFVTSRDFVTMRNWQQRGNTLLVSAKAIEYTGMPPNKNYTRGEFYAGGMVLEVLPEDPNQSVFYWFFNADMKGWLPPLLIEIGLIEAMVEYLVVLEEHVEQLKSAL